MRTHPGLDKLERKLLAAGGERHRQVLWEGVTALCGFALLGLFCFFLIDYLTRVPYYVRVALFAAGVVYGAWWFRKRFLARYREPYDAQSIALLVEKEQPEMESRLISTLQFQHVPALAPGVSADLVDGLVEQTFSDYAPTLDCSRIVNRQWVKKRGGLLLGGVAVWALLLALAPAVGIAYFMRLVLPDSLADYPRDVHIVTIDTPPLLPEGEEYAIRVKVRTESGKFPEIGFVDIDPKADGYERLRRDLTKAKDEEGVYEAKMPPLLCPARMRVVVGDDQRNDLELRPEKRPIIRSVTMKVEPPAYTGIAPDDPANSIDTGTALLASGSKCTVTVEPSKPLKSFTVLRHGTQETIPAKEKGGKYSFAITVTKPLAYTLAMTDTKGLEMKDAPLYTIGVIADRAPMSRVTQPIGAAEMAPRSRLPFAFEVRDDYKVSRVTVKYQKYDAKEVDNNTSGEDPYADRSRPRPQEYLKQENINQATFSHASEWNNEDGTILPGKIIRMWIEAEDNHQNVSTSTDIFVRVITEAEYRNLLLKKLDEHMEGADGMVLDIKKNIREMEKIEKEAGKK
ncbi:MAG: hypothetical protein J6333_12525 [Planctomycetes bacterium]|nr:hypothetical protein [Planctomycetota bacterium]